MIYQSMSGDADSGTSSFTMNDGSLTNANGDIFFVNNTACTINLADSVITNNDPDGIFLRAEAAGWGNEGSNGGKVIMTASDQNIDGDMIIDEVSTLNLYLSDESAFNGSINSSGAEGGVYVELTDGSKWTLTADSYINSLTCDSDSIDLNGHTLYVDGKAYASGTASSGEAIEITAESSSQERPSGDMHDKKDMGAPPEKPSGDKDGMGAPPESR